MRLNRLVAATVIADAHPELLATLKGASKRMDYDDIIARFESLADPAGAEGMARFGIAGSRVYGIRIPVLRRLAKETVKRPLGQSTRAAKVRQHGESAASNHELALKNSGVMGAVRRGFSPP